MLLSVTSRTIGEPEGVSFLHSVNSSGPWPLLVDAMGEFLGRDEPKGEEFFVHTATLNRSS